MEDVPAEKVSVTSCFLEKVPVAITFRIIQSTYFPHKTTQKITVIPKMRTLRAT